MKKGRRYESPNLGAFDVSRNEPDTTVETVLDDSTAYSLLDTSRPAECDLSRSSKDLSANNSFNKLPDDNMNSELTRSTEFQLDNSKIQPTLQPNGWNSFRVYFYSTTRGSDGPEPGCAVRTRHRVVKAE